MPGRPAVGDIELICIHDDCDYKTGLKKPNLARQFLKSHLKHKHTDKLDNMSEISSVGSFNPEEMATLYNELDVMIANNHLPPSFKEKVISKKRVIRKHNDIIIIDHNKARNFTITVSLHRMSGLIKRKCGKYLTLNLFKQTNNNLIYTVDSKGKKIYVGEYSPIETYVFKDGCSYFFPKFCGNNFYKIIIDESVNYYKDYDETNDLVYFKLCSFILWIKYRCDCSEPDFNSPCKCIYERNIFYNFVEGDYDEYPEDIKNKMLNTTNLDEDTEDNNDLRDIDFITIPYKDINGKEDKMDIDLTEEAYLIDY